MTGNGFGPTQRQLAEAADHVNRWQAKVAKCEQELASHRARLAEAEREMARLTEAARDPIIINPGMAHAGTAEARSN